MMANAGTRNPDTGKIELAGSVRTKKVSCAVCT